MSENEAEADDSCANDVPVLGIVFGTTYCEAAISYDENIKRIKIDSDTRYMSTVVAFTATQVLVGDDAFRYRNLDPKNCIYDITRLLGLVHADKSKEALIQSWPFKLIADEEGKAMVEVEYKGETIQYYPEEIAAMIIRKIKKSAEEEINIEIKNVVLTVPVGFSQSQRLSLRNAATLAGLNVLQLINKPTAAAIAYTHFRRTDCDEKILVVSFGGGCLSTSIVEKEDEKVFVLASSGNIQLGGEDFDNRLVDYFRVEFERTSGNEITGDAQAMSRLKEACEIVKCSLSYSPSATLIVDSLYEGKNFTSSITRARFEDICEDLFISAIDSIASVFSKSDLDEKDIAKVVLFGHSAKIPKLESLLADYFNDFRRIFFGYGKPKILFGNEDRIVYGATMCAAKLLGHSFPWLQKDDDDEKLVDDFDFTDVTTSSLGIGAPSSILTLIPRYTSLPHSIVHEISISKDARELSFSLYEEKNPMFLQNIDSKFFAKSVIIQTSEEESSMDEFAIEESQEYKVTFSLDKSEILNISIVALNWENNMNENIVIKNSNLQKREQEMDDMRMRFMRYEADLREDEKRIHLELSVFNIKKIVTDIKKSESNVPKDLKCLEEKCEEVISWLDENRTAAMEDLRSKENELSHLKEYILNPRTG